jgi:broad specificity phosphatase PhoE
VVNFFLIRHASTDSPGVLNGRAAGVHLSSRGRLEALELARRLESIKIDAVWSSPLERAGETANPIAAKAGLRVLYSENLNEVNYGEWTGQSFESLASDPRWRNFNLLRGVTRIPGGELITDVQARVLSELDTISIGYETGNIVVVTHAEPIRVVLACWLNSTGYLHDRVEISPASISIVRYATIPMLICVNNLLMPGSYLEP